MNARRGDDAAGHTAYPRSMAPLPPRPTPPPPAPAPPEPSRLQWLGGRGLTLVRRWWVLGLVLTVCLGLAVTALVQVRSMPPPPSASALASAAASAATRAVDQAARAPSDASAAYQAIGPSLVVIQTDSTPATGSATAAPGDHGLGAGVVVDATGRILTANHVVAGAARITVIFADGTHARASVQTAKPETDIAVLVPDATPQVIAPATLGGGVRVGDPVFAVGHPLGLTASLTAGVVSATGRTIDLAAGGTLEDLIQFDAAVNPGNSGGPLLDRQGRVVGIVTALANPAKQPFFVGIGFAVPIATAGGAAGGPAI
jgi:S1-C subfamily serine protease